MMGQDCNPSQVKPYVSQYGLQARVIAGLSPNDASKIPAYIKRVSIFLAVLTAFLLALVVQKIRALFGGITASVFAVCSQYILDRTDVDSSVCNIFCWLSIF